MKLRILAVAAALSVTAACGGSNTEQANTAEENLTLEGENIDTGVNATDPTLGNADLNVSGDLNADANASGNLDSNASLNADANATANSTQGNTL
jgi:hypothetical protein